ncbi:hypothetical protein AB0I81_49045 [Nonomuraea sp. NPDC050404]|uniref:hypothetical protein n=1 Tax=Nonomuraea sp. NPDC050404 TaxID=3155783 RepID=UPI00340F20D1
MRIVLPVARPGLISAGLLAFLMAWDEFFYALIFTSSPASKTVPVALAEFTGRYSLDFGQMAACWRRCRRCSSPCSSKSTSPAVSPRAQSSKEGSPMSRISMSEGLRQQPDALAAAIATLTEQLADPSAWPAARRPLFVAMGASHAALAACVHRLRAAGIWAARAGCGPVGDADLVVGVSQSGRSAETVAMLREAPPERRLAVVNVAPSPLAELAGRVLSCGSVADSKVSTSGFSVTLAALGMLGDVWADGRPDPVWRTLPGLLAVDLPPVVERVAECVAVDVVGGGASLTAAEEGALLLREACRLPATAAETRQYLHGPMESAGPRTAHVIIGDEREAELAAQLAGAGHLALYVGPCESDVPRVAVPRIPPVARAIVENAVLQRLVAAVAEVRGVPVGEFRFSVGDTKVDSAAAEAV